MPCEWTQESGKHALAPESEIIQKMLVAPQNSSMKNNFNTLRTRLIINHIHSRMRMCNYTAVEVRHGWAVAEVRYCWIVISYFFYAHNPRRMSKGGNMVKECCVRRRYQGQGRVNYVPQILWYLMPWYVLLVKHSPIIMGQFMDIRLFCKVMKWYTGLSAYHLSKRLHAQSSVQEYGILSMSIVEILQFHTKPLRYPYA